MSEVDNTLLIQYVKYLLQNYIENHPEKDKKHPDFGRFFIQMNQYIKQGYVKDILSKNSSINKKIDVVNFFYDHLCEFNRSRDIQLPKTFNEYEK